jgi:hypothetical protein
VSFALFRLCQGIHHGALLYQGWTHRHELMLICSRLVAKLRKFQSYLTAGIPPPTLRERRLEELRMEHARSVIVTFHKYICTGLAFINVVELGTAKHWEAGLAVPQHGRFGSSRGSVVQIYLSNSKTP